VTYLEAMLFGAMMGFAVGMTFLASFVGLLVGLHGG
jgi:hypothetical protein